MAPYKFITYLLTYLLYWVQFHSLPLSLYPALNGGAHAWSLCHQDIPTLLYQQVVVIETGNFRAPKMAVISTTSPSKHWGKPGCAVIFFRLLKHSATCVESCVNGNEVARQHWNVNARRRRCDVAGPVDHRRRRRSLNGTHFRHVVTGHTSLFYAQRSTRRLANDTVLCCLNVHHNRLLAVHGHERHQHVATSTADAIYSCTVLTNIPKTRIVSSSTDTYF